jgi:hypothetical protein
MASTVDAAARRGAAGAGPLRPAVQRRPSQAQTPKGGWQLVGDPTEGALLTLAAQGRPRPRCRSTSADAARRRDPVRVRTPLHGHAAPRSRRAQPPCCSRVRRSACSTCACRMADGQAARPRLPGKRVCTMRPAPASACWRWHAARCLPAPRRLALDRHHVRASACWAWSALIDPPRDEAIAAVAECQRAGLRVKMITGDHAVTAAAIGRQLGLNADHALTGEMVGALDDDGAPPPRPRNRRLRPRQPGAQAAPGRLRCRLRANWWP